MMAKTAKPPRSPGRRPKNPPFRCRLALGTITEARRTLARFIKAYDAAELSESQYRAHVYGMRGLLDYLQASAPWTWKRGWRRWRRRSRSLNREVGYEHTECVEKAGHAVEGDPGTAESAARVRGGGQGARARHAERR
jgi:hypothetical protein